MCGICGFVTNNGKIKSGTIRKMLAPLKYRGPDDEGVFKDNAGTPVCELGHRRLSIIDLETGHQPITDETGDITCVHNGEIYNFADLRKGLLNKGYKFKTNSDAEVIVNMYREYGADCIKDFNGMFAFAIWDKRDRSLLLCRDRVGIKPLSYYYDGLNLLFSSSVKSFLELDFVSKEIDFEAFSEYLQYLYINSPRTIFKSIRKLEPGTRLIFKDGKIRKEQYWKAQDVVAQTQSNYIKDEKECASRIRYLLKDSVERRLISDVPLGIFLSGGVDSSIITALARESRAGKLNTFSVTFKGGGYYDESRFARKVSNLFETDHNEIEIEPDLTQDLPGIIDLLDEPFADSSFIPTYYLSKFTREHVKVGLSGTGGDDIFAGYRRYAVDSAVQMYAKSPAFLKKGIAFAANKILPTRETSIGEKALIAQRFLAISNKDEEKRHNDVMSFINMDMQRELLTKDAASSRTNEILEEISRDFKSQSYVNRSLYTDFVSYLSGDLLVKEDRATMAVGLEGRVPFLDHLLVEYSFKIDPGMKVNGMTTKYILKKAFESILPKEILYREKHGFAFPISEYLRNDMKDSARDILFSGIHNLYDEDTLDVLFNRHTGGREDLGQHIWALIVFNLWYQRNLT